MPAKKPFERRPFRVLEAGAGEAPLGIVRKAQEALRHGRTNRSFAAVDEALDVDKLLKKAGIKELPKNLALFEGCVSRALERVPPESTDVIFSSYLFNNLHDRQSCIYPTHTCQQVFVGLAHNALKPGGRMVFVQDKGTINNLKEIAKAFGYSFYAKEIPDEKAMKSPAKYIRMRATRKRRKIFLNSYLKHDDLSKEELKRKISEGVLSSAEDYVKPTLVILRKPKNEKRTFNPPSLPEQEREIISRLLEIALGFRTM